MSTIRVVNIQHTDATEPNIVLEADGTTVFASGITISGGTNLTVSGTAEFASGTVSAPSITFIDDNNTGIYSPAVDTVAVATSGTGRLFIDSNGRVGIGEATPTSPLHISSTAFVPITLNQSGAGTNNILFTKSNINQGYVGVASSGDDFYLTNSRGADLIFGTNNTERMRIDSSGLLGIGTTSPSSFDSNANNLVIENSGETGLTISTTSTGASAKSVIHFADGSVGAANYAGYIAYLHDVDAMQFGSSTLERMRIDSSGNIGIGNSNPSHRLSIAGTANNVNSEITITATSVASAYIGANANGLNLGTDTAGIVFKTGVTGGGSVGGTGIERMRIDSSGRLLVGTSTARTIATQSLAIQNEGTSFGNTGFSTCRNSNDVFGPYIHFGKSRGTSVGSNTIVGSGDDLGGLIFGGADGTDVDSQAAYILCQVDGTPGVNDMPGRLVFYTTPAGASSPAVALTINRNGELFSVPTYTAVTTNAANIFVASNGNMSRSSSSRKYKTNIETLEDQYADRILDCRPVWFRSTAVKDNPDHGYWGFIAEEVAEIDPRLVHWKTIEISYNENGSTVEIPCDPEPEGVQYDRFVPHLLNLIKRQQQAIETLKQRLSDAGIA